MNSNDWAIIRQHLQSAIRNTVTQFQDHPADFLSERDIQAVLFTELRNEMRHSDLRMKYETSSKKDRCFGQPLDISRVMTEYRLAAEGPCDIAILCCEQDTEAALWAQPCRIGSEIKFWQALEYHNWNEPRGPQKDVEKLHRYWKRRDDGRYPFTGIAMLFRHPEAFSCQEVVETAGEVDEAAFPENGVAIHVISKEDYRWNMAPDSRPTVVTAPTTA
jgi:hypothetical protein